MNQPFKYFDLAGTFEDNKALYRFLSNQYHPDKPTGNEEMMKAINAEWELIDTKDKFEECAAECEPDYVFEKWEEQKHNWQDEGSLYDSMRERLERMKEKQRETINTLNKLQEITFRGMKYDLNDEDLPSKIAMRHGGLGLMEFYNTKEWKEWERNNR